MQFAVLDEQGSRVGKLTMVIHTASGASRLNERFNRCGGFGFFVRQLPISEVYPFAEVDIQIHREQRRQGYGRRALRAFNALATSRGAKWGFLWVATQGEDYDTGVPWRHDFYQREGWEDFQPLANAEYWPSFMFNLFGAPTLPMNEVGTILQELECFAEWMRIMESARPRGPAE